jgi:hypothetical protein
MADYKYKVDEDLHDVVLGDRPFTELIKDIVVQAHQEANFEYDESAIEQFVKENCTIQFVYSNIPFRFYIK